MPKPIKSKKGKSRKNQKKIQKIKTNKKPPSTSKKQTRTQNFFRSSKQAKRGQ